MPSDIHGTGSQVILGNIRLAVLGKRTKVFVYRFQLPWALITYVLGLLSIWVEDHDYYCFTGWHVKWTVDYLLGSFHAGNRNVTVLIITCRSSSLPFSPQVHNPLFPSHIPKTQNADTSINNFRTPLKLAKNFSVFTLPLPKCCLSSYFILSSHPSSITSSSLSSSSLSDHVSSLPPSVPVACGSGSGVGSGIRSWRIASSVKRFSKSVWTALRFGITYFEGVYTSWGRSPFKWFETTVDALEASSLGTSLPNTKYTQPGNIISSRCVSEDEVHSGQTSSRHRFYTQVPPGPS